MTSCIYNVCSPSCKVACVFKQVKYVPLMLYTVSKTRTTMLNNRYYHDLVPKTYTQLVHSIMLKVLVHRMK